MQSDFDTSAHGARAEAAIAVARQVGREAAAFRSEGLPNSLLVESKGLQDFVTIADKRAEQLIRETLLGAFPHDTFIGEEGGGSSGSAGTWVVDPIDGTTNFIRGFRHWGVSIAFVVAEHVEIGVIYDAAQDAVFHAVRGQGAFREGRRITAAATTDPNQAIAILGHSRRTNFDDYLAISRQLHELGIDYRRMGAAAIGLVRVAEGVADLYYERHLNAWDIMAGMLIASEAGAIVATPPLATLIADGGPVVACAQGLEQRLSFLRQVEGLMAAAG